MRLLLSSHTDGQRALTYTENTVRMQCLTCWAPCASEDRAQTRITALSEIVCGRQTSSGVVARSVVAACERERERDLENR